MNFKIFLLLIGGLAACIPSARGQTAFPNVIGNSGSGWVGAGGGYTVAWTTGETVIWTGGNAPQRINQGFHAPLSQIVPALELNDVPSCRVFPNPVDEMLSLEFNEMLPENVWQLSLWNLLGQRLHFEVLPATPQYDLDCSSIAPGIYLLRLEKIGLANVQTVRFIKN